MTRLRSNSTLVTLGKLLLVASLITAVYFLVRITGGIKYVFSHTMYLPILLAAYFFGPSGGILAGLFGGLVLGPIMPISVSTGEMQDLMNWLYRLVMFTGVGAISGFLFTVVNKRTDEVSWMATHSLEIGLPNYNHFIDAMKCEQKEAEPGTQFALVAVRINNYSEVTAIFNVEETRALSVKFSQMIKCLMPVETNIYHYFSHTFFFYLNLNEFSLDEIRNYIDQNFYKIEKPVLINRIPLFFKISVGLAVDSVEKLVPSSLFRKANWAANLAAEQKLKSALYDPETDKTSRKTQRLLGEIKAAANKDHFELFYQPIIKLKSSEVVGMEALIRWNHPELGYLQPMDFLPYCENTSLIFLIHDWVMKTAIKKISNWPDYEGFVSINLSTRMLIDGQWIDTLVKLLEAYKVDASRLVFEVTESSLIEDQEESIKTVKALCDLGARIAIDDFGTGYSSFEYVYMLPVQYLKIDRSFIKEDIEASKSQAIIKAIIQLSEALEIQSIAEGVETQEQLDWLTKHGCDYVQGFLLSRPLPNDRIGLWMDTVQSTSASRFPQ
ncbi:MAG: EAL domain-containing protein [Anaerolineaceae bacterium]|nr:EAL domain-containing protein [Anaerolineaceae bacterium]